MSRRAAQADDALAALAAGCSRAMSDAGVDSADDSVALAADVAAEARSALERQATLRRWVAAARARAGCTHAADAEKLEIVRDIRSRVFEAPELARFALSAAQRAALAWAVEVAPRGGGGWDVTHLDTSASPPARVCTSADGAASDRWLRALVGLTRFADVWRDGPYDREGDDQASPLPPFRPPPPPP